MSISFLSAELKKSKTAIFSLKMSALSLSVLLKRHQNGKRFLTARVALRCLLDMTVIRILGCSAAASRMRAKICRLPRRNIELLTA